MSTPAAALLNTRDAVTSAVTSVRRGTFGLLGLRLLVWASGVLALLIAAPPALPVTASAGLAVAIGALPALAPGRWVVAAVELLAATVWMLRSPLGGEPLPSYAVVAALAVALYVHHSVCALAAALPYDTRLAAAVVRGWGMRVTAVTAGTILLAALISVAAERLGPTRSVMAPVVGVLLAVALAVWIGRLATRRSDRRSDRH